MLADSEGVIKMTWVVKVPEYVLVGQKHKNNSRYYVLLFEKNFQDYILYHCDLLDIFK